MLEYTRMQNSLRASLDRLRARRLDLSSLSQGAYVRQIGSVALMALAARIELFGGVQVAAVGMFAAGLSAGMPVSWLLLGCILGCGTLLNPALLWPIFGCLLVLLMAHILGERLALISLAASAGIANLAMIALLSRGEIYALIMALICGVCGFAITLLFAYALSAIHASASAHGLHMPERRRIVRPTPPDMPPYGSESPAMPHGSPRFKYEHLHNPSPYSRQQSARTSAYEGSASSASKLFRATAALGNTIELFNYSSELCPQASASRTSLTAAAAALFAIVLMGLNGAVIPAGAAFAGFSFTISASIVIALAASFISASAGCAVGTCCWLCALLCGWAPELYSTLPAAALAAALVCRLQTEAPGYVLRAIQAGAFITVVIFCMVLQPGLTSTLPYFELLISGMTYMLLPPNWLRILRQLVRAPSPASAELMQQQRLTLQSVSQLTRFADAAAQLSSTLGSQSRSAEAFNIVEHAKTVYCDGCARFQECWCDDMAATEYAFAELNSRILESGALDNFQFAVDGCVRSADIATRLVPEIVNSEYERRSSRAVYQLRTTYAQQLSGLVGALNDGAREIKYRHELDMHASSRLYIALTQSGIPCAGACIERGVPKVIQVWHTNDIATNEYLANWRERILRCAAHSLGYQLELSGLTERGLILREAPPIKLACGVAKRARLNNTSCGDSYSINETQRGLVLIALSDGMGSGDEAAHESANAVSLLENLLCAGLDSDSALRSVNELLLTDGSADIYATLDLSIIDRYNCVLEICKLGAPATYLIRNGECSAITGMAPPAGIISAARAAHKTVHLQLGDIIVQFTDGVCDVSIPGLQEELMEGLLRRMEVGKGQRIVGGGMGAWLVEPKQLASDLLEFSSSRFGARDDATVLVSQVLANCGVSD